MKMVICVARSSELMSTFPAVMELCLVMNWMCCVSSPVHMRVESAVFVSSVVNSTNGSISFHQHVMTFNLVTVTFLSLFLDVVSVFVLHSVLELVFRWYLQINVG